LVETLVAAKPQRKETGKMNMVDKIRENVEIVIEKLADKAMKSQSMRGIGL